MDDLEFEDIANEDGIKNLLNRLKEYYMPHLEVSLPRAFENAVYGQQRQAKESFAEYVHRLERAFALLSKEGVDLPKGATGYILYRQAGLTEAQDQRVLTWCEGRYDRDSIVKALRRLDKVLKEKSSKASYATEGYEVFENDQVNQSEEHLGDSDQEFIYVAEGDLDGIYEEKDMLEALASYREVRQALKEQKTNRGFFPGKGFGGFKDGGKSKGKSRVHKEQLKLRTRCWKCGQIGHISAECTNKVVIKEGTSQASSSGSTGKSSFFVSTAEDIGVAAGMHGETSHDFWLRNFVERRAKTRNNSPCEADAAYKSATIGGQTHQDCGFHGIVTCSFEGVVDTAAEGGLIGSFALKRLQHELNQLGLCCRWTPKTSAAKGVGGQAQVVGVILIPLGLGGINGVLETTVIEGDVPLLLPIRLLKTLDAIINIPEHHVFFGKHAVTVPMRELSSGHMVIRVTEFAQAGFQVPEELQSQYDFRCGMEERETNAVMLAQQRLRPGTTSPRSVLSPCASLRPDGRAGESNSKCGKTQGGDRADDFKCSSGRAALNTEGCAKLAGDVGQAMHFAGNGGVARGYRRLVPAIIGAGILALVRDQAGGHLCRDHSERTGYEAFADQRTPSEISKRMCAPKEQVEGRWQQSRILDSMSRMQFEMGESVQGDGGEERLEEGEPREETGLFESRHGNRNGSRGHGGGNGYGRGSECQPGPHLCGHDHGHECRAGGTEPGVQDVGGPRKYEGANGRSHDANDDGVAEPEGKLFARRSAPAATAAVHAERDEGEDTTPRRNDSSAAARCGGVSSDDCRANGESALGDRLRGRGINSCRSSASSECHHSGSLSLPTTGRTSESEQRRSETRPDVLEVHPEAVQFLSVGCDGTTTTFASTTKDAAKPSTSQFGKLLAAGERPCGDCGPGVGERDLSTWTLCCTRESRKKVRKLQGRGAGELFHVDLKYQVFHDEWQDREGLVPIECEQDIRVELHANNHTFLQQLFDDGRETQFNRRQRRTLKRAMACFHGKSGEMVSEVFSPPRVVEQAARHGLTPGKSYDLVTGWDLSDPVQVKAMWKQLHEDRPLLIVLSPPCAAFSPLQEWNFPRMSVRNAVRLIVGGLEHLELSMQIAKWQHRQGRYFMFEHPDLAKSWEEDCVEKVAEMEGVFRVTCDMCRFNLRADGVELNRKPTGLLLNSEEMARHLSRRCQGGHEHQPLLHGLARKAQKYTMEFCRAVLQGLKKQMVKDGVVHRPHEIWAVSDELDMEEDEEEPIGQVEGGEAEGSHQITEEEKAMVKKLHRNVGHPQQPEFIRYMRAGRVRPEVIRWAAKEFKCDVCEAKQHPKSARPATIPRSYQPNKVIGVDITFIPQVGGGGVIPVLNVLDWGTNYQMMEMLEGKQPQEVWEALQRVWFRIFGVPEIIVTDQGREFSQVFQMEAAKLGILSHQTAARAPWQQGRTERHGAHFKEILEKARAEEVITDDQELVALMREVEQAKNRYSNRSGFAPVQRQIGQWPRVPNSLLSDDHLDVTLVDDMLVDDIERLHKMRRLAQKAFVEVNAKTSMRKALLGRPRPWENYEAGDLVYVYRVPKARRTKTGAKETFEIASNKAMWVGPGTVVVPDGANLWISMMGELWKVAREQCRKATSDERQGVEAVMQECQDLIQEYKRNSKRAGYKDITGEAFPPHQGEEEVEESPLKKVRFNEEEEVHEMPYTPESPIPTPDGEEARSSVAEPEREVSRPSSVNGGGERIISSSTSSSMPSTPSEGGNGAGGGMRRMEGDENAEQIGLPEMEQSSPVHPQVEPPEFQEAVNASRYQANRLDGHPHAPSAGPVRWIRGSRERNPYLAFEPEFHLIAAGEDGEEWEDAEHQRRWQRLQQRENPKAGDFWRYVRCHQSRRSNKFNPVGCKDLPLPIWALQSERSTDMKDGVSGSRQEKDDWRKGGGDKREKCRKIWWTGETRFQLEESFDLKAWLAAKKGQDEIDLSKEPKEELEGWKLADAAEWAKIEASGAVRVLSTAESEQVKAKLNKENKLDRILPTKVVRRRKPAEQPGEEPSKKSRICIRGDLDPDILDLERFSPTITTVNFNVLLQLAANRKMWASIGYLRNAFCQSQPLERKNGPIYFQQPKGGIPGLEEGQIIQILAGCYGLVDAPLHWRRSLLADLAKLGYQQSKLDPCIWKIHDPITGELEGAVAIEVDDLFTVGHARHHALMNKLQQIYTFGKYVELKEVEQGAAFNGRRIKQLQDGSFKIDMQKFVEERLFPIELEKGRSSQRRSDATSEEVAKARAVCGSLNWLAKEGRPDAAGPSSLHSSKLANLKIEDILAINGTVKRLKETAEFAVILQPLHNMKLSIVTDASFANNGYHSQGGQMVIAHEPGLRDGLKVKTNLVGWRSGRLQRVVNSTLAAETQSLSRGLGDLMWIMVLVKELSEANFRVRDWKQRLSAEEVMVLGSEQHQDFLKHSLAIIDAKSLFDYLAKDTVGGQDRRTAIEIQIIREDLRHLQGQVRWVDHPAMLADGLTKIRGNNEPLYRLVKEGVFRIQAEESQMALREQPRQNGQRIDQIRRAGVRENFGSCDSTEHRHVQAHSSQL